MASLLLNDVKFKVMIDSVGISSRTAYVWRMKVYAAAFEIQKGPMLFGEMLDRRGAGPGQRGHMLSLRRRQETQERFQEPGSHRLRGRSSGNRIALEAGRGHVIATACVRTYNSHIAKGSLVVHDGIFSHDRLISFLESPDEVYKSTTREGEIEERIDLLESYYFQAKASFKVKDQYRMG